MLPEIIVPSVRLYAASMWIRYTYYALKQFNITKDGENKLIIAMKQLCMQEQSVFYALWPVIADIMCIIHRQIVSANILNS